MVKKNQKRQRPRTRKRVETQLPPGVRLLRTLKGHNDTIRYLVFDPRGETLASAEQ